MDEAQQKILNLIATLREQAEAKGLLKFQPTRYTDRIEQIQVTIYAILHGHIPLTTLTQHGFTRREFYHLLPDITKTFLAQLNIKA